MWACFGWLMLWILLGMPEEKKSQRMCHTHALTSLEFLFFSVISQVFCVKFSVFYSFCQAVCDNSLYEENTLSTPYSAQNADILWYIITLINIS